MVFKRANEDGYRGKGKKIRKLDSQNDDITPTTSFSPQPSTSYASNFDLLPPSSSTPPPSALIDIPHSSPPPSNAVLSNSLPPSTSNIDPSSPSSPQKSPSEPRYVINRSTNPPKIFKSGLGKQWEYKPVNPASDYATELNNLREDVVPHLEEERKKHKYGMKAHITAKAQFDVIKEGELVDQPTFHYPVKAVTIYPEDNIFDKIAPIFTTLDKRIQDLVTCLYQPNKGGSYIRSPRWLSNRKATINIKSKDDKCIL